LGAFFLCPSFYKEIDKIRFYDILKKDSFFNLLRYQMKKKPESTVNLAHARNKKVVYEKIVKDKVCPFCVDFSKKGASFTYHTKPILIDGVHWVVTENFNKYRGTKYHFLLVHRKHLSSFSELRAPALKELVSLTKQIEEKFSMPAGVLMFRFGDTDYTGGSVNHFHAHLVLGVKRKKEGENNPLLLYAGYMGKEK
jgi:ATP adenylyltransferase